MTATTPCYRHSRGVWIAACPDCTAWHLEGEVARRDEVVAVLATARPPDVTDVPPTALRLAA